MGITAKEVNKLRTTTGAGMMDCKRALVEANGDFEKAIEELRKKGQKISASRSNKEVKEGAVFIKSTVYNKEAVLIALNCETDFVVKNEAFQQLGSDIVDIAISHKVHLKEKLMEIRQGESTVAEKITELVGKVGERIEISRLIYMQGENVVSYVHAGGKLGILVSLKGGSGAEVIEIGKNVGMQIAAMNPIAVDEQSVDKKIVEKEMTIIKEQILAEGKPENMAEKIAQGKLKKFYKESTLLNQSFVKNNKQTVAQYLASVAKDLTVKDFCRVSIA